jgi:hypothetical protein
MQEIKLVKLMLSNKTCNNCYHLYYLNYKKGCGGHEKWVPVFDGDVCGAFREKEEKYYR